MGEWDSGIVREGESREGVADQGLTIEHPCNEPHVDMATTDGREGQLPPPTPIHPPDPLPLQPRDLLFALWLKEFLLFHFAASTSQERMQTFFENKN